jgi:hypothetical protein
MQYQLRRYRVKPGQMDRFGDVGRSGVVPLRQQHGFSIVGAWNNSSTGEFVWIVGYDGDYEAADKAYYSSPGRSALDPDPGSFLDEVELSIVDEVPSQLD